MKEKVKERTRLVTVARLRRSVHKEFPTTVAAVHDRS